MSDGLEERHALDVSDRPSDFNEDDVRPLLLADGLELGLDFVRDVRDDLDRPTEIVPAALLLDDRAIDLACRDVVVAGQVDVQESFVVAQVEIDLRAVVEDEHLAVLVGIHRARVDVQVRVDFDGADLQSFRLQQDADRGSADALPES